MSTSLERRADRMSIASDMLRGNTDMIILAHLNRRESYGYEINKQIQQLSGGGFELKEATLYGAFRRLEEAGYVASYWGDETTGARRRYYRITPGGQAALAQYRSDWFGAVALITGLIEPPEGERAND
jgi:DNA-binding PadR family transcriptional regulator